MKKPKPLIETNPYLTNPKKYRKALRLNVASSTAIKTGASVESIIRTLTDAGINEPKKSRKATTQ